MEKVETRRLKETESNSRPEIETQLRKVNESWQMKNEGRAVESPSYSRTNVNLSGSRTKTKS
jgi:hypothetical protein